MKLFAYIFIGLILLSSCKDDVKPIINNEIVNGEIPTQESWDSKILITGEGLLKAILYSDHILVYDDRKETLLEGVKINFFDDNEVKTSQLTSKRGRIDDKTKDMFAIDSVVAQNDSGTVLRTDELHWINKTQKITTDKFVTITTKEERIEGYGFISDQGLKNYTIYNVTYSTKLNGEDK
ncbi:MAG: LPS export ABC transporter periplasmic protein LptC [Melioribacteraceae bacterium]|nr:MAG: LPS export ABC transporter periplasmic protein LptC [Melioribacteraceae bacterium]